MLLLLLPLVKLLLPPTAIAIDVATATFTATATDSATATSVATASSTAAANVLLPILLVQVSSAIPDNPAS